ncbi:hypothetical protein BpHYR1_000610 [Brachionus plicatilis]|uniref:Uncharacterized protein n=1 Tax=Brachionus plicatilis TaxID=10195 RepID=A0A3M7R5X7_BRAPC|nr:hypothetical protein BpHYR1_000610 [Brachionus plicatilis]
MSQNFKSDKTESTSNIGLAANDENVTEDDVDEPLPKRRRSESVSYEKFKAFEALAEYLKELKEGLIENTTWCSKENLKRINQELFSLETYSNLAETPITIETQSIESEPSTKIALLTANDNSIQTVQKSGKGVREKLIWFKHQMSLARVK